MGTELVTDGGFASITLAGLKGVAGITKANPGVLTLDAGHGYANGDVIYLAGLSEMTELNGKYWKLRNNSGDTFEFSNASIATWDSSSLDTSGYGAAEVTGGNCARKASLTSWTESTGWQVDVDGAGALTGRVACDGEQAGASNLNQTLSDTVKNQTYKTVFTVAVRAAGTVTLNIGGTDGTSRSSAATFTEYLADAGSSEVIGLQADGDFIGSIDNVSAQLAFNLTPSEMWPLEPEFYNVVSTPESGAKQYSNIEPTETQQYQCRFRGISDANWRILFNHYKICKGGFEAFTFINVPSYLDTDLDGDADGTALVGRWVPGSYEPTQLANAWDVNIKFEVDV